MIKARGSKVRVYMHEAPEMNIIYICMSISHFGIYNNVVLFLSWDIYSCVCALQVYRGIKVLDAVAYNLVLHE